MNTDSLTDFSWSRHQINVLITSGVVENEGWVLSRMLRIGN